MGLNVIAALRNDLPEMDKLSILARLCMEGENGWWCWYETLQKQVYTMLVYGLVSSDLMFGNPASGAASVLGSM